MNRLRFLWGVLGLVYILCPSWVTAQTFGEDTEEGALEVIPSTPTWGLVELRVGPYAPNIDAEPGLRGAPYHAFFGDTSQVLVGGEFDLQLLHIPYVGTLSLGLSGGYASWSGSAFQKQNPSQKSGDTVSFSLCPLALLGVLRFDALVKEANIPLAPYLKGGVGVTLWHTQGPAEAEMATGDGQRSMLGYTLGAHLAGGLAFELSFLDRYASLNLSEHLGIRHTYLFGEYTIHLPPSLGQVGKMQVGANTWTGGLGIEF